MEVQGLFQIRQLWSSAVRALGISTLIQRSVAIVGRHAAGTPRPSGSQAGTRQLRDACV